MVYVATRAGLAILGGVVAVALSYFSLCIFGLYPGVLLLALLWLASANALVGWLLRPRPPYPIMQCLLFSPGSWLYAFIVGMSWFNLDTGDFAGVVSLIGVAVSWPATLGG